MELPAGQIVEYKYALLDSSGTISLAWQQGNNSVLALRRDDREVCPFQYLRAASLMLISTLTIKSEVSKNRAPDVTRSAVIGSCQLPR